MLGTAGYMSPEQAAGQQADARSDLFSLGCVLYEMLSGKRAFVRDTVPETLTAILREDPPPWRTSRRRSRARSSGSCCTASRSGRRTASSPRATSPSPSRRSPGRRRAASAAAAPGRPPDAAASLAVAGGGASPSLAVAAVIAVGRWPPAETGARRATFVDIALPPGVQLVEPSFARLSDDGRQLVFAGLEKGQTAAVAAQPRLAPPLARSRAPRAARRWPGREMAAASCSRPPAVVLKEIEVVTGAVRTLGVPARRVPTSAIPPGAGTRPATSSSTGGISSTSRLGSRLDDRGLPDQARGESAFDAPQFLPDGRHYLLGVMGTAPGAVGRVRRRSGGRPIVGWFCIRSRGLSSHRRATFSSCGRGRSSPSDSTRAGWSSRANRSASWTASS